MAKKDKVKQNDMPDDGLNPDIVGEIVADDDAESPAQGAGTTNEIDTETETETLLRINTLYADKIKSQAAEFENFRNRTIKEMGQMRDRTVREVVLELLPIIDNFGLALKNADTTDGFASGMLMIQNQMLASLEKLGITKIEAIGQAFDIKYHSAVSHIEDENLGESVVADELQAGYVYKDAVIRHAVVVVAN